MKKMRCGECGKKDMEYTNAKGRSFPYMQYDKVELTVDCDLMTCPHCDNIGMWMDDCERLDAAIEASLTRALG